MESVSRNQTMSMYSEDKKDKRIESKTQKAMGEILKGDKHVNEMSEV